jgi:arylsulfatase A-like enzyme/Tfp pilus assembly protein PilF
MPLSQQGKRKFQKVQVAKEKFSKVSPWFRQGIRCYTEPIRDDGGPSITRRKLIIATVITVALLGLVAGAFFIIRQPSLPTTEEQTEEKTERLLPEKLNIILITIDTLRADRLSCYGSDLVETPKLDAIASEGIRFTNTATTVPFTLPAHSSIMTGTYPPHHGVRENVGYSLGTDTTTVAELLQQGGYATAGFVSAFVLDSRWGIGRGFDHYHDDFDPKTAETPNLASVQRPGEETIAAAIDWLDKSATSPFFVWIHLYEPHDPYTPPEPYLSQYDGRPYDGEVAYTDALIGQLRQELESRQLLDSSLLIVTSDHGEGLGDHDEAFHGFFVYDTTIHVPLIIRTPFPEHAGRVVTRATSHVDLLPTMVEAAGLPVPDGTHGRSLLSLALGGDDDSERAIYSESFYPFLHYGWAPLRSLRSDRYKLIEAPRPELFDVVGDRSETHNLAGEQSHVLDEMSRRLQVLREEIESEAASSSSVAELDEAAIAQLQALGYLAGEGGIKLEEETDRPRSDPKDKIELHRMIMFAQAKLAAEEEEAAERLLTRVLARDDTIVDANQMLGQIVGRKGRHEEAARHFQKALEQNDSHQASLLGLAGAYRSLGRIDEAVLGFRRVLEIAGTEVRATLALAEIYVEQEQQDQAEALLEEAIAAADPPGVLFNQLGELRVLQGRDDEAVGLFEQAIAKNDKPAEPYFNLAVIHEDSGGLHKAISYYEQAIERAPRHFQAQFNLGRLYGHLGNPERQQELWQTAIESNPEFVRGYYYLAKLMMDRGLDLERAEQLTRQGLARDPDHVTGPLGYYILADLLNRQGRTREAQDAVRKGRAIESASQE